MLELTRDDAGLLIPAAQPSLLWIPVAIPVRRSLPEVPWLSQPLQLVPAKYQAHPQHGLTGAG
jgi:hypothetical protein